MTIRELLRSVQLENLAEAFERESITPDILKDLTDADLRELGVVSMADRKRLMRLGSEIGRQEEPQVSPPPPGGASASIAAVGSVGQGGPTPERGPSSVPGATTGADAKAERVFYEGVVEGATVGRGGDGDDDDGGDDDAKGGLSVRKFWDQTSRAFRPSGHDKESGSVSIRVTSHRAIIGPKTFLLHNIAAVQVGTKKGESVMGAKISAVFGAVVCFAFAIGMACTQADSGAAVGCCAVVGLACLAGLFAKGKAAAYSVRIDASGTSSDAIASEDKAKMQEIVDAINRAIVNLNVAK
jgi:hypothetical protein